jgi:hypothetical protein
MKMDWNNISIGLGIASIIIGLLRIFLWDFEIMDSIELFIIGFAIIALSSFNRNKVNKN